MRIGIDIDNTLINYAHVWEPCAQALGYAMPEQLDKTALRDFLRTHYGDEAWQRVQADVYGTRIMEAQLFEGSIDALNTLRAQGHKLHLISHKTQYSNALGPQGPDLHAAALRFLAAHGVDTLMDSIQFCPTRQSKCAAIAAMNIHVFIDDLDEIFTHPDFPAHCRQVLFGHSIHRDCILHWKAMPLVLHPPTVKGDSLVGGRNSRVLRKKDMVIKHYPHDKRARCAREWEALHWLWQQNISHVPRPLACIPSYQSAVFEFIDGNVPAASDENVREMAQLMLTLYAGRHQAQHLRHAAEACFSGEELHAHVQERIHKLLQCSAITQEHEHMHDFIRRVLLTALATAFQTLRTQAWATLDMAWRMPSPSDFGLHNALQTPEGKLVFLDFEYFGLDDPTKLMADTLLHPGMQLTADQRMNCIRPLLHACELAGDKYVRQRLAACLPLWRIKWCCILLNCFLTCTPNAHSRALLTEQLKKSRQMLNEGHHATTKD